MMYLSHTRLQKLSISKWLPHLSSAQIPIALSQFWEILDPPLGRANQITKTLHRFVINDRTVENGAGYTGNHQEILKVDIS